MAVLLTIALLLLGLGLLWAQVGFGSAVLGVLIYFFILPIVTLPILRWLKFVPEEDG